jgi:hypothetical protein
MTDHDTHFDDFPGLAATSKLLSRSGTTTKADATVLANMAGALSTVGRTAAWR